MPAYITGIIWVCRYWNLTWLRYQLLTSVIVHALFLLEVIFYIVPIQSDDTWFGWSSFAKQLSDVRAQYPKAFIFSADDYKTSSVLNFYLPEMVYAKNIVGERALQYDFIGSDLQLLRGKDALFIDSNPSFDNLENENGRIRASYRSYFDQFYALQPILVWKNGKVIRKFSVFYFTNYHPPTPNSITP